ncbi:MAG: ATPase superfamilylike protein [Alphaproteobacteria bacterium]|jgi:predicted AAA+ superfamily ATPase|nr:ATPase superfamilylike protein [Alphaproteobacteria bacterium]
MVFYQRWQSETIKNALKTRRVALLNGPRQCGKTTLAKQLVSIIDEIQRVPSLLVAIKKSVDEDKRPGQYLLTESANIQSLPSVQESLAGRITKIRLKTLSQGEIQGSQPIFLEHAFNQDFHYAYKPTTQQDIIQMAAGGGFPEAIQLHGRDRKKWHQDYVEALLERDLKDIAHIQKHDVMNRLVGILAAWSSK